MIYPNFRKNNRIRASALQDRLRRQDKQKMIPIIPKVVFIFFILSTKAILHILINIFYRVDPAIFLVKKGI